MSIDAIPTTYNGVRMRSQLEADWAASLDVYGFSWSYEPCALTINDIGYLPDFYLPVERVWLEIKGPHNQRLHKPQCLADEAGDPWDARTPMVVIGREAVRGRLTFHGATIDQHIVLAWCPRCDQMSFCDLNTAWVCRICRHWAKPNRYHESGELWFHQAPRETQR